MVSGLRVANGSAPSSRHLSVDAVNALRAGNVAELLRLNKAEFGGFSQFMAKHKKDKKDDDDDDDDDTDDDGRDAPGGDDDDDDIDKSKDKDDDSDDDDDSGDDDDDDDDKDKDDKVSRAEYEKALKRMKAADRRAAEAEKAEQKRKRKEMTELEGAQTDIKERDKTIETLQSEVGGLRLQNAFLAANKITWHDPDTALALAETKGYLEDVVDDEGVVDKKKLSGALKKLAKDNQYLVKKGSDASDDDDDDDGDRGGRGSSGARGPGRSRNGKDKDAQTKKDARRAPSLGRRRPAVMGSRG